ncbi:MAG TPA: tetratricopeptide repeat protein, partial [Terriglobia bacterium]|nr:tetratricopeptide repeat protein [Terriglobia bacterium]
KKAWPKPWACNNSVVPHVGNTAVSWQLNEKSTTSRSFWRVRSKLPLDPSNEEAHRSLGAAIGVKNDWDGEIAEEREAIRLQPNDASAHYLLGFALEQKRNFPEALQQYRAAYELNPQGPNYQKAYQRLVKKSH